MPEAFDDFGGGRMAFAMAEAPMAMDMAMAENAAFDEAPPPNLANKS